MPRKRRLPSYRHHKHSGLAYVVLNGQHHYLGAYGSTESKKLYDKLLAEWLEKAEPQTQDLTVSQVCAHFWRHAKQRYGSSGKGRYGGAINWRPLLRLIRQHYGRRQVSDFGPKTLKSLRAHMVEKEWSRGYVNDMVHRTKQMFSWAASEELIPHDVHARLTTVGGLRYGELGVRERPEVEPVDDAFVDATLPFLSSVTADMVRIQRLTGCRPGEVCVIRPCDVDRSGPIWIVKLEKHKTRHHGKSRTIYIGPKGQDVLRPYLLRDSQAWCFQSRGTRCYTTDSYRRAIHRGCERLHAAKAKAWREDHPEQDYPEPLAKWSPNQLRHTAGTAVRAEFGAEHAQAILGHSNLKTTEIYAERDAARAIEAAQRLG